MTEAGIARIRETAARRTYTHTAETKQKISASLRGRNRGRRHLNRKPPVPFADEHRAKLSEANRRRTGTKYKPRTAKIVMSDETKLKISRGNLGKRRTPEQCANLSAGHRAAKLRRQAETTA